MDRATIIEACEGTLPRRTFYRLTGGMEGASVKLHKNSDAAVSPFRARRHEKMDDRIGRP